MLDYTDNNSNTSPGIFQGHAHMYLKKLFAVWLLLFLAQGVQAQTYADSLHSKRLRTILIAEGVAYGGLLFGLNELWYKGEARTRFHFFNDNKEWQQVDKAGHTYSTYHLSRLHYEAYRWTGLSPKKAAFWGSVAGLAWMLPIEILDGFSAAYGASGGDLIANTAGALLFGSQQLLFEHQYLTPKYSFHPSKWASKRPQLLGRGIHEQFLKDYNGQTYWLSADLARLTGGTTPRWLNIALGYGASGMVYANEIQNIQQGYNAYSQIFLAPDLNLRHIRTNKKAVRLLLFVLEGIHIPMPAVEFSRNKFYFHPVYF